MTRKASELRDMSVDELKAMLVDLKAELFGMINDTKQTKKIDNPDQLHKRKKTVARILTILTEKEMAETVDKS